MKRRDFIKAIGLSCMGSCFNPLGVLAAGNRPLQNLTGNKTLLSFRLNPLKTSTAGITILDDITWDPEPLLQQYDDKR